MAIGFRQCAKERENDEIVICEIFKLYQFLSYQEIVIRFCTFQVTIEGLANILGSPV